MNRQAATAIFVLLLFASASQAQVPIFLESFDGVLAPNIPPGWITGVDGWVTSSSSVSPGSGSNNFSHIGMSAGAASSPVVDLTGFGNIQVSFLARRTSSYPADSLRVTASIDGGITFPIVILASGDALPVSSSTYQSKSAIASAALNDQSLVRFRVEARGGTTSGANIRIDDFSVSGDSLVSVPPPPPPIPSGTSRLGLPDTVMTVLEESSEIRIPVNLIVSDSTGLQGLQFALTWNAPLLTFRSIERGPAVADTLVWALTWEPSQMSVNSVLLDTGALGLPPGEYPGFLSANFGTGSLSADSSESVMVSLAAVIGSLAVPEGSDAAILADPDSVNVIVSPRRAFFSPAQDSLDLGAVPVDTVATAAIQISNPSGTRILTVNSILTSNPLFTVSPSSFTLFPDSAVSVQIQFVPADTMFGTQRNIITFLHDGVTGPVTTIPVTAVGVGGRGDVTADGFVDVGDAILGIDAVLSRVSLASLQRSAADLFPFPSGDNALDVRDLTVIVQAIVRGAWPDTVSLPPEPTAPPLLAGQVLIPPIDNVQLVIQPISNREFDVTLITRQDIRGFEAVIENVATVTDQPGLKSGDAATASSFNFVNVQSNQFRVLFAPLDGSIIGKGSYRLARIRIANGLTVPVTRYVTAIGPDGKRLVVNVRMETTSVNKENIPGSDWKPGSAYPNPIPLSGDRNLRLPLELASPQSNGNGSSTTRRVMDATLSLYDVLGRRVSQVSVPSVALPGHLSWRLPDSIVAGVYFLKIAAENKNFVQTITVVQ